MSDATFLAPPLHLDSFPNTLVMKSCARKARWSFKGSLLEQDSMNGANFLKKKHRDMRICPRAQVFPQSPPPLYRQSFVSEAPNRLAVLSPGLVAAVDQHNAFLRATGSGGGGGGNHSPKSTTSRRSQLVRIERFGRKRSRQVYEAWVWVEEKKPGLSKPVHQEWTSTGI